MMNDSDEQYILDSVERFCSRVMAVVGLGVLAWVTWFPHEIIVKSQINWSHLWLGSLLTCWMFVLAGLIVLKFTVLDDLLAWWQWRRWRRRNEWD